MKKISTLIFLPLNPLNNSFGNNQIGDEGAESIARGLKQLKSLKHVEYV